jgi:IS4 transposase
VRIVEYALPGSDGEAVRYRLMTSLLDPAKAPAMELAALYHTRWQVEAVFDELKTHLQQRRRVLRSKTPELVRQEFYGWVLAHYAVRWLMHQTASEYRLSHAELSFTGHVQLLRRTQPLSGAFPPRAPKKTKALVS